MRILFILLFLPIICFGQKYGTGNHATSRNDSSALAFMASGKANITNSTQRCAVNCLAKQLRGYSLWTNMKCIWPMVGGNATAHSYNLRNTASANLTFTNTPTQNSDGVDWNGTSQYATTAGVSVSSLISNRDSVAIGYYTKDDATTRNSTTEINTSETGGSFNSFGLRIAYTTNSGSSYTILTYLFAPSSAFTTSTSSSSKGFYISSRTGSAVAVYKNGSTFATGTQTSNSQSISYPLMIGASGFGNSPGAYTDKQCAFAFVYNASISSDQATRMNLIVTQYQTILGRQN